MNIQSSYIEFLNLVNRNATNNNVSVDLARFILLYNDIQVRYLEFLTENRGNDDIREANTFLVTDKALSIEDSSKEFSTYNLPDDYFDLSNLSVKASDKECRRQDLHTFEIKFDDYKELWNDKFNEPSFKFRETFYSTSENRTLTVFKKGFEIEAVNLHYYRYPRKVDIEGYEKEDQTQSQNIDPEWNERSNRRILVAMSKEFSAINSDTNQYQLSKDRLFNKI
jgi:hypothetical protein